MKKIFLAMLMAVIGLCASAQEAGDMAAGLNIGFAPCTESGADLTNFGLGAKFQYNITDPIRLEADMEYWFKAKHTHQFDITVNGHYLFTVADGLRLYPLVGLGYAHVGFGVTYEGIKYSDGMDKFLLNFGVGGEYDITDNLALGMEIKLQYIQDFTRVPVQFGIAYKF
ncbi:MAG: porin family protein [Pseudoflavonifractor sp.]|nr:porin family protein [Alloprevotella sp.]MCM1116294.1 porin family protein [Pseudoflavonifractor sp.]